VGLIVAKGWNVTSYKNSGTKERDVKHGVIYPTVCFYDAHINMTASSSHHLAKKRMNNVFEF
jgi:hypothetical protein